MSSGCVNTMTASTANHLWSLDDVLGQGATASVYKARNKVLYHYYSFPIFFTQTGHALLNDVLYCCRKQVSWLPWRSLTWWATTGHMKFRWGSLRCCRNSITSTLLNSLLWRRYVSDVVCNAVQDFPATVLLIFQMVLWYFSFSWCVVSGRVSKDILNFTKYLYFKQMLFVNKHTFDSSRNWIELKNGLNKTLIIRNVYWAPNQYIRIISERSCDTEAWGCWKFSFNITWINYILIIFHNITVFRLNKCTLGGHKSSYWPQNNINILLLLLIIIIIKFFTIILIFSPTYVY